MQNKEHCIIKNLKKQRFQTWNGSYYKRKYLCINHRVISHRFSSPFSLCMTSFTRVSAIVVFVKRFSFCFVVVVEDLLYIFYYSFVVYIFRKCTKPTLVAWSTRTKVLLIYLHWRRNGKNEIRLASVKSKWFFGHMLVFSRCFPP